MDWFVKAFLKASLAWLGLGVGFGLAMAIHPVWTVYRAAHMHMNLLGFVAMMIFGVAYHVIPRFTGHPLFSKRLAGLHWWAANAGLAVFVLGLAVQANAMRAAAPLLGIGGLLSAAGSLLFILNIWRTIDGRERATVTAGIPLRRNGTLPIYESRTDRHA